MRGARRVEAELRTWRLGPRPKKRRRAPSRLLGRYSERLAQWDVRFTYARFIRFVGVKPWRTVKLV